MEHIIKFLQIVKHQVGVSASEALLRNPKPGKQADNLWCDNDRAAYDGWGIGEPFPPFRGLTGV